MLIKRFLLIVVFGFQYMYYGSFKQKGIICKIGDTLVNDINTSLNHEKMNNSFRHCSVIRD